MNSDVIRLPIGLAAQGQERAVSRRASPEMPSDLRDALADILADALVASYVREHGLYNAAMLRYRS